MFSLIVPYYNQPRMLEVHLDIWNQYPPGIQILLVDDGSQHAPALPVVQHQASPLLLQRFRLYRMVVDVPWARSSARNLGAQEAQTDYIVQIDIDHVLRPVCAERLLIYMPQVGQWYRFSRYRRGAADDTRNKDALPRTATYGRIHEHIDSYLIERALYWEVGGYNEMVFNGVLGGGSEFLHRLSQHAQVALLPDDIFLEVYTKHVIPDASVTGLSRETAEYSRRRRQLEASGKTKPERVVCVPWERVL